MISLSITVLHYIRNKNEYRIQLRTHLEEMANSVARCIDADLHAKLQKPEDMESETYSNLYIKLLDFKEAFKDIRYIYTMRVVDNKIIYVVDADNNPESAIPLGEEYDGTSEELLRTVSNLRKPASDKDFTTDRWGTWLSGYAPIITSEEKYDGFVGVDMTASSVREKERALLRVATLQLLAALFFAIICGQVVGNFFASPIEGMIGRLKRMRQGNFQESIESAHQDELGELSDQINLMSENVGTYIEKLEHELEVEKEKTTACHAILELLRHSSTPYLLLKEMTVIDCNQAAVELFKTSHRMNIITRPWAELSAGASGDNDITKKLGIPFLWKFFDLAGEPFPHLIELSSIDIEGHGACFLVCFVKYSETASDIG